MGEEERRRMGRGEKDKRKTGARYKGTGNRRESVIKDGRKGQQNKSKAKGTGGRTWEKGGRRNGQEEGGRRQTGGRNRKNRAEAGGRAEAGRCRMEGCQ